MGFPEVLEKRSAWPEQAPREALELLVRRTDSSEVIRQVAEAVRQSKRRDLHILLLPPGFDGSRGILDTPILRRELDGLLVHSPDTICGKLQEQTEYPPETWEDPYDTV